MTMISEEEKDEVQGAVIGKGRSAEEQSKCWGMWGGSYKRGRPSGQARPVHVRRSSHRRQLRPLY